MKKNILILISAILLIAPIVTAAPDMKWEHFGKNSLPEYSDPINLGNNNYFFIPHQVTPAACYPDCVQMQMLITGEYYEAYVAVFDKDNFVLHWAVDDIGQIEIFDLDSNLVASKQKTLHEDDGTKYIVKEMTDFGERYTVWKPNIPSNGIYRFRVKMVLAGGHENYVLVKLCSNAQGTSCEKNTVYENLSLNSKPFAYRICRSFCETDITDTALCDPGLYCVYNKKCYQSGTAHELTNDSRADAVCDLFASNNVWYDCDFSAALCSKCDSAKDITGCNGDDCYVSSQTFNGCCGDDANELFIKGKDNSTACCQNPSDIVKAFVCYIDADKDGFSPNLDPKDCNDNDATIYPGAPEVCGDNKDNDCNGKTDEVCEVECSSDNDCPKDDWTGSPFCYGNNINQNYRDYSCLNPGQYTSDCNYTDTYKLKQTCPYSCENGACAGECNAGETRQCPIQQGVCEGSQQTCINNQWQECDYSARYGYERSETKLDGLDNDCNGIVDDGFPYGWRVITNRAYEGFPAPGVQQTITKQLGKIIIENNALAAKVGIMSYEVDLKDLATVSASSKVKCDSGEITMYLLGQSVKSNSKKLTTIKIAEIPVRNSAKTSLLFYVEGNGKCSIEEPLLVEGPLVAFNKDLSGLPATGCCPLNQCWDGFGCVDELPGEIWGGENSVYRCVSGKWSSSVKFTWDNSLRGWCPLETDCLVNPNAPAAELKDYMADANSRYSESISEFSPSIECIHNKEYLADHYCNAGNWETRTRDLALQLLGVADAGASDNNYVLFCDNYASSLNAFEYGIEGISAREFIIGMQFKDPSRLVSFYSCFLDSNKTEAGPRMDCANNFCAIKYVDSGSRKRVAIATSLNKDINGLPRPFISALGNAGGCNNVNQGLDTYQRCVNTKIWYNPVKKTVIYTDPARESLKGVSFIEFIKNPISSIITFVLNIWGPKDVINTHYEFMENTRDFNKIYLASKSGKSITGFSEKKAAASGQTPVEYFAATFDRFESDLVPIVKEYAADTGATVDARRDGNTQYITASGTKAMGLWLELTSKLRMQ